MLEEPPRASLAQARNELLCLLFQEFFRQRFILFNALNIDLISRGAVFSTTNMFPLHERSSEGEACNSESIGIALRCALSRLKN